MEDCKQTNLNSVFIQDPFLWCKCAQSERSSQDAACGTNLLGIPLYSNLHLAAVWELCRALSSPVFCSFHPLILQIWLKKTIIRIQPKTLLSKHFGKLNSLWSWLLSQITSTFFSVNLSFPSFSFVFCHSLLHWRSLQFFNYMRKKEPMPHALPMYRSKRRWSCLYWTSNWIKVTLWNTVAISSPGVTAGGLASAKNIVWFKSIPPVISG